MKRIKSIGIIGIGKLGESLLDAFLEKKLLKWLVIRNPDRKKYIMSKYEFKNKLHPIIFDNIEQISKSVDCTFLTVNDSSLTPVVKQLKRQSIDFNDKFFIHCSGLNTSRILTPLKKLGAIAISAHPFQTFFIPSKDLFNGIYWGIETDFSEELLLPFRNLIYSLGSYIVNISELSEEKKVYYHLSAVFSSNFLSLILYHAYIILQKSGLKNLDLLKPIITTTINNFFNTENSKFPITGPAVRADITTIKKHLIALKEDKDILFFYREITKFICYAAYDIGILPKNEIIKVMKVLDSDFKA